MMKRIYALCSPLAIALLLWSPAMAQKKKYEFAHERTISQRYPAAQGDELKIDNQFGNVVVKTWNRNEIKVDIRIEVSADVQEAAQTMFENIDVKHSKKGNKIEFKTDMHAKSKKGYEGRQRNTINIDYEISMPGNLALSIENKFGKTIIPDYEGPLSVEQQFGNLEAGRLAQPRNIDVRFGGVVIESAVNGNYDFQFANDLATIRQLSGKANVDVQHCKKNSVLIHATNIDNLSVDAQHSDVAVIIPKNISVNISVDTHFGSFRNKSSISIPEDGDDDDDDGKKGNGRFRGPKFKHSYNGKAGDGKARISLDGNFSEITLTHEVPPAKKKSTKI